MLGKGIIHGDIRRIEENDQKEIDQHIKNVNYDYKVYPLLANLFLHYAFDMWMAQNNKGVSFERYADDIVCHCHRMSDAVRLKENIKVRLQEVGLEINAEKSNIVYIDTFERTNVKTYFTFLGYDFKVRTIKNFKGELYRKCMPGASKTAMNKITRTIKSWRIHRATESLEKLAQRYNVIIRGWIEYYGKYWNGYFSYHFIDDYEKLLPYKIDKSLLVTSVN